MRAILILVLAAPAVAGTFDGVRGELPRKTAAGAHTGSIAWGAARADARLERFGGTWTLAVRPPVERLIDFARGLDRSPLAGLDVQRPVVVFAPADVEVDLVAEAAAFYGVKRLHLKRGVNVITKVRPRPGSQVAKLLDAAGVRIDGLVLEGVILRGFDASALQQAKKDGKLEDALRKGTMLTLRLPKLKLDFMPKTFWAHEPYFYVTGEPGFGFGFTLCTMSRTFQADFGMRRTGSGATETVITAKHKGRWNHAFDIPGFHIEDGTFLFAAGSAQTVSIGMRAKMMLGRKRVSIAGKATMHVVTSAVTNLIAEGSVSSIGSGDLVAVANGLVQARKRHDARALPDFALRDVSFRFAPLGGDERLGIDAGMALKGRLVAMARELARVDGAIDQTTKPATLRLHGNVADFAAGPLALRDAAVAVNFGPTANPYFRIKGKSRMWITSKEVDVDLGRERMFWALSDRVGGVYAADYKFRSRDGGRVWAGEIGFRNDLSRTLERDVARAATAWANGVERDFARAQAHLNGKIAEVKRIDGRIAAARRTVHGERAKALADLRRAEAEVKRLDGAIHARKKWLYDHQMKLYKTYQWHQRNVKSKHAAWRRAVAATKNAKVWDKPKYKAREAKAWAAYHAAGVARDKARVEYDLARKKVDVQLQSLQATRGTAAGSLRAAQAVYRKVTGGVSVDADPRVASLLAQRGTAVAALTVARETVKGTGKAAAGAGRVTAWAAKHHGQVLMVDGASMAASLGGSLRGTGGRMTLNVRFLGERYTLRLNTNLEQVRRGLHAIVWAELRRLARL